MVGLHPVMYIVCACIEFETDAVADHEWPAVDMSHRSAYRLCKDEDKNRVTQSVQHYKQDWAYGF